MAFLSRMHRRPLALARFLAAPLLALLSTACEGDVGPAGPALPTGSEIMHDTVETTILRDVAAFESEARALEAEIEGFCQGPSPAGLGSMQDRWNSTSEAWNAIALYNLGPLDDDVVTPKIIFIESMRQRGTDYSQTVRDAIARGVASSDTLDVSYFEAQTFDEVGMLALEVLVFEDSREGHDTSSDAVLEDFMAEPRKCAYLRGATSLLANCATEIDQGWNESFQNTGKPFKTAMTEPALPDGTEPVTALLITLSEHLDYVKVRKLEGTLDAQLSGHFYPNVTAMLGALDDLLTQPGADSFGLLERMQATGNEAEVELVHANIEAAKAAARGQDRSALAAALGLIEGNLKREVPNALGVDLGLTFTDGD